MCSRKLLTHPTLLEMDEKSPFRPCGRNLVEFSNNTGWAFLVNLTPNRPASGWPVISKNQFYGRWVGALQCGLRRNFRGVPHRLGRRRPGFAGAEAGEGGVREAAVNMACDDTGSSTDIDKLTHPWIVAEISPLRALSGDDPARITYWMGIYRQQPGRPS